MWKGDIWARDIKFASNHYAYFVTKCYQINARWIHHFYLGGRNLTTSLFLRKSQNLLFFGSWSPVGIKVNRVSSIHLSFKCFEPRLYLVCHLTSKNSDWVDRFRNITIRFVKTRHYLQLVACVWGNVQYFKSFRSLNAFIACSSPPHLNIQ